MLQNFNSAARNSEQEYPGVVGWTLGKLPTKPTAPVPAPPTTKVSVAPKVIPISTPVNTPAGNPTSLTTPSSPIVTAADNASGGGGMSGLTDLFSGGFGTFFSDASHSGTAATTPDTMSTASPSDSSTGFWMLALLGGAALWYLLKD